MATNGMCNAHDRSPRSIMSHIISNNFAIGMEGLLLPSPNPLSIIVSPPVSTAVRSTVKTTSQAANKLAVSQTHKIDPDLNRNTNLLIDVMLIHMKKEEQVKKLSLCDFKKHEVSDVIVYVKTGLDDPCPIIDRALAATIQRWACSPHKFTLSIGLHATQCSYVCGKGASLWSHPRFMIHIM
eukprot:jgi/Botrbrau1/6345/Bobra.0098s0004.1